MGYYRSWPRAVAISRLLSDRYGRFFAGLFRTKRSVTYLSDDEFRGVDLREASEDNAPWVAETESEPPNA